MVTDWLVLEEADNAAIARISGERVLTVARQLNLGNTDALIILACVQMPSFGAYCYCRAEVWLLGISEATARAYILLHRLGLSTGPS